MLFFFYNAFSNKPIGMNCDSINLVVSVTNATFNNLFNVIDQLNRQNKFILRLIVLFVSIHMALSL